MAVPVKQSLPITFTGGLDTKTDPKQIAPTDFLELNNMVFSKGGSLVKRNGFETLGTIVNSSVPSVSFSTVPALLDSAKKVFSYNDELLINDAWNLYSYQGSDNTWNYKGRSTVVELSTDSIVADANTYTEADMSLDLVNGLRFYSYYKASELFYSIQDIETGQIIVNKQKISTGLLPIAGRTKVISYNGSTFIFFAVTNGLSNEIWVQEFNGSQIVGAPFALITNLNFTAPNFDIYRRSNGQMYFAYYTTAGAMTIQIVNSNLTLGASQSFTEVPSNGINIFPGFGNLWVCWASTTETKYLITKLDLSGVVTPATLLDNTAGISDTVNNITGVYDVFNDRAYFFWDRWSAYTGVPGYTDYTGSAEIFVKVLNAAGTNLYFKRFIGSLNIASKAFLHNTVPHILTNYTYPTFSQIIDPITFAATKSLSVPQASTFLLNLYNTNATMGSAFNESVVANIAGVIQPGQSPQKKPTKGFLPSVSTLTSGIYDIAIRYNNDYGLGQSNELNPYFAPTGVMLAQLDFINSKPSVEVLGNNALIGSGQVAMYDSGIVCEQNFHIYPNAVLQTPSTGAGGSIKVTADSTYSYIFVYEWIDNQGQVHRSFPSPAMTPIKAGTDYTFAAGTTNGYVTLTIPTLQVTNKPGTQVVINVYRTLADGDIYYLLTTFGTKINDPTVQTITYLDSHNDDDIRGNLQLYTTGALGYTAPPATKFISNFKSRAIVVPAEEKNAFWYSNQTLPNFPVQFTPFFIQNVNSVGGEITATSYMDDKLIIFKSGKVPGPSILFMVGQGPAPSGANNDFGDPLPISIDVGCVEKTSIVQSPVGLIFKSNKGIFLLDRSLQTTYIGAAVEKYNNNTVISGQLIPNTTQVRFILDDGTMLMFDYFYQRWATFTTPAAVSDCIWQGEHTFVTADGQVYKEKPNTFADGTTPVYMSFKTAWIKLANLQNYQRAYFYYLLGECQSSTELECSTYFDFATSPAQTNTITPIVGELLTWRIFLANQRCQAFQISLQEKNGTVGEGFNLSGLNLVAGLKNSFIPQPNAYTVG